MKPIHVKRLKKLIAFLRKLPRKRFNFAIVRNEPPKCGAVGCAIGYMPNVFPRVFKSLPISKERRDYLMSWGKQWTHEISFRGENEASFEEVATWITGLETEDSGDLFTPNRQQCIDPELPSLPTSATPKQVAAMLEKFIKLQTAKK